MLKIYNTTLAFFLFLSGLVAQEWTENLPQQKVLNGTITLGEVQQSFYKTYPKDEIVDGKKLVDGKYQKIPGWKQFKRWEWYWENRIDKSTGRFPSLSKVDQFLASRNNKMLSFVGGEWTNLGPNTSAGGYSGLGRINCIAFHPTDNNTYWVGSPSGGLWVTTDDGNEWDVLTDNNDVLGVSTIALSNNFVEDNTIFIGTGDRDGGSVWSLGGGQRQDNNGVGILKSIDGGQTWQATGLSFLVSEQVIINKILINPNDNNEMLASTSKGIYKSIDGGNVWESKLSMNFVTDMEYKPGDPTVIYASTKRYYSSAKIFRSINAGETWMELKSTEGRRIELAVSANQPDYLYAISANSSNGLEAIYRSNNSGESFEEVSVGSQENALLNSSCSATGENNGQGSYDLCIAADPNDANTVYIGGINTWKSIDGGVNWELNNFWTRGWLTEECDLDVSIVHADKHYLAFQNGSSVLFEANDGGVYKSSDGGFTWEDKSNGLAISQIYRFGVGKNSPSKVICGLQDNGSKLTSDKNWQDVTGGDGMECIIDYTNSDVQYSTYVNGRIYRTVDNWASRATISDNIPGGSDGAWVTPYLIDPVDNNTLYVGYKDVWKTIDQGDSWTKISTMNTSNKLRSMAIAPSDNQVLYVADHLDMWKTTDGGENWSSVTSNLPVWFSNITYITVKEDDPSTLWVTFGGYNNDAVYQSIDGGTNWTNISSGLPSLPVMTIVENTKNTNEVELFVGTDAGVYRKVGNSDWESYAIGLPNVMVTELEIYYDNDYLENCRLKAATYGRGLWETPLPYTEPENIASENFDSGEFPSGWESDHSDGIEGWIITNSELQETNVYTPQGSGNKYISEGEDGVLNHDLFGLESSERNNFLYLSLDETNELSASLVTASIDIVGYKNLGLKFDTKYSLNSGSKFKIYVSTDNAGWEIVDENVADGNMVMQTRDNGAQLVYKKAIRVSGINPVKIKISVEDATGGYVSVDNVQLYGTKSNDVITPIELYSYKAQTQNDGTNLLEWISVSEINNDYYTVYKSKNGFDWEELQEVQGMGNFFSMHAYSLIDKSPYGDITYYKLTQTDYDGTKEELGIQSVFNNNRSVKEIIQVYPNPAKSFLNITGLPDGKFRVKLLNTVGLDVYPSLVTRNQGQDLRLDMNNLIKGVYCLLVEADNGKVTTLKVIKE